MLKHLAQLHIETIVVYFLFQMLLLPSKSAAASQPLPLAVKSKSWLSICSKAGLAQPSFAFKFPFLWNTKYVFPQIFEHYCFINPHLDFLLSNKTTNPRILLRRSEAHIVHFHHELYFDGFEGQVKHFQTANPKDPEL